MKFNINQNSHVQRSVSDRVGWAAQFITTNCNLVVPPYAVSFRAYTHRDGSGAIGYELGNDPNYHNGKIFSFSANDTDEAFIEHVLSFVLLHKDLKPRRNVWSDAEQAIEHGIQFNTSAESKRDYILKKLIQEGLLRDE